MKPFSIHLQSPSRYERIDGVVSFVGSDESGSFGILPGHERMMTVLIAGIARVSLQGARIEYLGLPEGALYFVNNELFISTTAYLRDGDYAHLSSILQEKLKHEEQERTEMRETIQHMEKALLQQLLKMPADRYL